MTLFFEPATGPEVRDIAVLVLDRFSNLTLAAAVEPLRAANRLAGRPLYHCRLLSPDGHPVRSSSAMEVAVDASLADAGRVFALLVLASYAVQRQSTRALLTALGRAARGAATLGGLEDGAYVLARAGLLDGYRATIHWEDLARLTTRHPGIRVVHDRYVVDRDRATSGGAIPTLDLVLNMIRHHHGLALAQEVAATFVYEQDTPAHDPQRVVALGRLRWLEPALAAAVAAMENHLDEPLPVAALAERAGISERRLQRLFARLIGTSPARYYTDLRLGAARRLLANTDWPIAEIADACGFRSRTAFARAYRTWSGHPPSAARSD